MVLHLLLVFSHEFLQELQNVSIFNSFVISFIFIASAFALFMYNNYRKKNYICYHEFNTLPSPPKLPIIGNLHQLGARPHRSLQALSRKYGPIMLMHIGAVPTIVVSSAELVKEMVKSSHDIIFSNRHKITAAKVFLYDCQDIIFANCDENWRQARKICALHLLSLERVQYFWFVREEEVAFMIDKIRSLCCINNNGSSLNPFNLTELLTSSTSNILSRCVFGKTSGIKEDAQNRCIDLIKVMPKFTTSICFCDLVPWLGWLDVLTGLVPKMKCTFKEWDSCIDQVIEEHEKSKNMDRDRDFVDILLQFESEDSHHVMTRSMLKAILLDMILAGTETTLTSIEWMMAQLIKNPPTMKKAQEEVRRVIGKKTKIDKSDIDQMDYLKCVIKETFRLNCPGPLLVPRETSSNVKLGGYNINAKTQVIVNAWAIQRDPNIWGEDAEEFVPERFENNPIDFKGHDSELIPFGFGRRRCPGMSFGVAMVEYSVVNLLYWFDWALPEGLSVEEFDMTEIYAMSVPRKVPLHLVATMYSP